MRQLPIAIVGRACVLPGALSPEALWQALLAGRDLTTPAPVGRWGVDPERVLCAPDAARPDQCWSDRGGYVSGFESIWNPEGFALPAAELTGLDPLVHWTLHCAREALGQTRRTGRVGAVLGNLGFPSAGMAAFADQVWTGKGHADPRNRAMSGGTAALLARALNLDGGSYCLDAACASSLYAMALACEQLADGGADLMLAGAVQAADDLFLHQGFAALGALSRSGRSRPFHADADGLLPAEGCAILALKRLADAERDGDTVYALIHGVGLSNDGRGKGLLVPDEAGQQRAIRAAWANAGLDPAELSLLECHATGTPVGDAAELRSSAQALTGVRALPIGSLKSNLGHLITVAGAAGIIKLIEAMRHGVRPPNRLVDSPLAALRGSPFRLLQQPEPWPDDAPRIAAISAFGFGGNNAHLVLSDGRAVARPAGAVATKADDTPVAIVGLQLMLGSSSERRAVCAALFAGEDWAHSGQAMLSAIPLDLAGLRFPPRDLQQALPQQLAMLRVARAALAETGPLPADRTAVLIGMEPDAEVARYGTRWRLAQAGDDLAWLRRAQDAVIAPLEAAGVLGCMPNIPANRLNSQFDFGAAGYTLQAGPESGLQALRIAERALRCGQIDAALVGASDLCCEPVNAAAGNRAPADAAIAVVLKRLADAERDGDRVYALLTPAPDAAPAKQAPSSARQSLQQRSGDAGAAAGLLEAALGMLCLHHRRHPDGRPWLTPAPGDRRWQLPLAGMGALELHEARGHPRRSEVELPRLHCYAGADKAALIEALLADQPSMAGPARVVIVARSAELPALRTRALAHLRHAAPAGAAIHVSERPIQGELAFVYAGAGASYPGMGRELLEHFPQLLDSLAERSVRLTEALAWSFDPDAAAPSAIQQLWGASALSQLHLELCERVLGLKADAWMGYSSGETNALVAAGVWSDPDALMDEMERSGLITEQLGGQFSAVRPQWGGPVQWASWTVLAPVAEVRAALVEVPRVHLAIINSDADCLIAGDAAGCAQVVAKLGAARCLQLDYPLAVHVPELRAVAQPWWQLHHRRTHAPKHGRIYGNARASAYLPDSASCAQAILDQASDTLDLRPVVLKAWQDGVRVFIEHGPGGSFARAIRNILGEREALVLSLDRRQQGLDGVLSTAAALLAAGVAVDHERLHALLAAAQAPAAPQRPQTFTAHWPAVELPPRPLRTQRMAPAPKLPSVLAPPAARPARVLSATTVPPVPSQAPIPAAASPDATVHAAGPLMPGHPALLELLCAQIADLAAQQQRHSAMLSEAHQQFLATRANAQDLLWRALSPASTAADLDSVAAPLPASPTARVREPATPENQDRSINLTVAPPLFDRAQLMIHADGQISTLFGPAFAAQDGYVRQVRMPRPPLLLADRVTMLEGSAGSMGRGRIVTETDVSADAWYLHGRHMPAGVMIEAGQADLMLISWLGVDALNRGERVYRLLGCELTYHGDLPAIGDTLRFDIHLDGHASQGDVRLMFFHYDCSNGGRKQLSVRGGQAGFFTDAELAASAGCLWSPEQQAINPSPKLDPPVLACTRNTLERAQLEAWAAGDAAGCFGPGFELARTHTRSPALAGGRMLLIDRVSELQIDGGPWKRGYLRAEMDVRQDHWFFDGHFKNDPCMPGTLMFEGCLQAMAVYLAACGYTLRRDGWRFVPVADMPYALQCRGQVTPRSRLLVTEVFVEERSDGPQPMLIADLLCSVDGLKAFHARRVALQLIPDWPLATSAPADPSAPFEFDHQSLLACALGKPSAAFGPMYQRFDGPVRVARLPSPPYHFISRIADVRGPIGQMQAGASVVADYEVPTDAWYLSDNGAPVMPFAVLLEVALQPCGWLSSYVGSVLTVDSELGFRNLDGEGEVLAEVRAGDVVSTRVELTDVSASAGMIIEKFSVVCRVGSREVYRLRTVFGFFPPAALAAQQGLPISTAQRAWLARPANLALDLAVAGEFDSPTRPRLPAPMLRMIDRIDGLWPAADGTGVAQMRAQKQVDAGEWFFKAHFFQDPVQPGSLGLEAMLQTLQVWMLQQGLDAGIRAPRFESIASDRPHRWKYRGQVLPQHRQVTTTLGITETGRDERGVYALGDASLWVDGQRIYEAFGLGVRIVPGPG